MEYQPWSQGSDGDIHSLQPHRKNSKNSYKSYFCELHHETVTDDNSLLMCDVTDLIFVQLLRMAY